MECIVNRTSTIVRFLKSKGILSTDWIYRLNYMNIFGSKLYYRHKIESYRSCAFCRHLCYDKLIKKYVCFFGEYEACSSLVPCIVPDPTLMVGPSYTEEEEQVPWLFKSPCLNFEVLDSKDYFRNFISFDINSSIIRLEALEGIMLGSCAGVIPCHICASVNKEAYTRCKYISKTIESGKCGAIYDSLCTIYNAINELSRVS
ncbi:MAG TPA: hypothetical protein VHP38_00710 [Ruminiclostridium sp.]|nr:hypothetical protein [Ruminiclostridium sp.]